MNGKFTTEETAQVRVAIEEYCTLKNITAARLCSECDHKTELKGAWMEIAKRLPHRTVQSIYRHGLRQLHPFKRGPWTDAECEQLNDLVSVLGKKWSVIQSKLYRSADSCRDKYREMDSKYVRGRWNREEIEQLQRVIREQLRVDSSYSMKELAKYVESEGIVIPWSIVSRKLGSRSRLSCFKKWQNMAKDASHAASTLMEMRHPLLPANTATEQPFASTSDSQRQKLISFTEQPLQSEQLKSPTSQQQLPAPQQDVLPHDNTNTTIPFSSCDEEMDDDDIYLLQHIAESNAVRSTDISWTTALPGGGGLERWMSIFSNYYFNEDDEFNSEGRKKQQNLPISEVAKLLLEKRRSKAAAAVEAVQLPNADALIVHI